MQSKISLEAGTCLFYLRGKMFACPALSDQPQNHKITFLRNIMTKIKPKNAADLGENALSNAHKYQI